MTTDTTPNSRGDHSMLDRSSRLCFALAALMLGATASTATAQACTLDYQRADNMWAAYGRPDGNLGTETITVDVGLARNFVTDWKYEKTRNDGTNFFGSHLRQVTNKGSTPVLIEIVGGSVPLDQMVNNIFTYVRKLAWNKGEITIPAGVSRSFRADLGVVRCPKA
jgi:hypothetical protein